MAEHSNSVPNNGQFDPDDSFEAADAISVVTDDEEDAASRRQPIDLDAPVDDAVVGAGAPPSPGVPEDQSKEVQEMKAQLARANDDMLRARADLQNFRRRGEEERLRIIRDGNERLIKELFPVLDDFDLAVAAARQAQSYEQLVGGVEATARKFHETLAKPWASRLTPTCTKR
jgi:molecular chaperone GrpE